MKIKKISLNILVVVFVAFFMSGCLNDLFEDQDDLSFKGDPQLEFRPRNEVTVDTSGAAIKPPDEEDEPLRVQLIGEQRSSDLSVSFEVDTQNSTAVAGTHFNLVTTSPITLPANSSSTGEIEIEIIEDSVPDGEVVTLVLVLQDSDGVKAAENLKTYTLTIEGFEE